ncbi:hypothetical protein [Desulfofalx alkaliphila]|uniref:hypothetical protein n=1 Tax=Desulfofalx alkaliphila TaxID=105483 RepID=UPI000A0411A5|nr:hypothetical protein [Desulfofalx alkaliphila]
MLDVNIGGIFITLVVAVVVLLILSGLLVYLWNITMPDVFGIKEINYWQAFRLMLISSILLGGIGGSINF